MQKTERTQIENIIVYLLELKQLMNKPAHEDLLSFHSSEVFKKRVPDKMSGLDRILETLLDITMEHKTDYGSYKAHRDGLGV